MDDSGCHGPGGLGVSGGVQDAFDAFCSLDIMKSSVVTGRNGSVLVGHPGHLRSMLKSNHICPA